MTGPSTDSWRAPLATCLQLDYATDHNPLSSASQPIPNPPCCLLIYSILPKLAYEDVGDGIKSLAEVKVHYILCSPISTVLVMTS